MVGLDCAARSQRAGWPDYVFAYHDNVEIGPVALKVLGKKTGLQTEDL